MSRLTSNRSGAARFSDSTLPATCQNSNIAALFWAQVFSNQHLRLSIFGSTFVRYKQGCDLIMEREMRRVIVLITLVATLGIVGCFGGPELCEEPEFYEYAESGKRIEVPDDLDQLSADRELAIPEASPRAPREAGSGCLDNPPRLRTGREEEAET